MRILSYNIHGGKGRDRNRDYARIGRFLKEQQIDVALLQEFDTRPAELDIDRVTTELKTDRFSWFVPAPTMITPEGWYGNALLSRYPVSRKIVTDITTRGSEPRNILEVFLDTPRGPLHVVNTHKGLGPFERSRQMRQLNELLARRTEIPLVVGGDINEWQIFAAGLRKLNRVLYPLQTGPSFPTAFPIFHLDRMWCRPRNLVREAKVLITSETRLYSDHYPLLAEIDPSYLEGSAP